MATGPIRAPESGVQGGQERLGPREAVRLLRRDRQRRGWPPSTTLADLFVLPFCADPLSAVRALMRRQSNDEIDDGSAHGWQAGLRWWSGDSFFPASLW